jgi:group I intron endonuclease
MSSFSIYKITNLVNGKVYIGQTRVSVEKRFRAHVNGDKRSVSLIHLAIKSYGEENFKIQEIIRCETQEQVNNAEVMAIRLFNSLSPNGYNLSKGGQTNTFTEETGKKISRSLKKKFSDPNYIDPKKGRTRPREVVEKILTIKKQKGIDPISEETRKKLSDAKKGGNHIWYGMKAKDMPFGDNGGWNKGIPMKESSKKKRSHTSFNIAISDTFEFGFSIGLFNLDEVKYMKKRLSDGHYDVIVGFFVSKKIRLKKCPVERTREEIEEIKKYNRKINHIYKTYERIKYILKEVS